MFLVKWTKIFTEGGLEGVMYDSQLDFVSLDSAARFVAFLHRHATKPVDTVGGPRYTCHWARIVKE